MISISPSHLDWVLIRQSISLSLAFGKECRIVGGLTFINNNQPFSAYLSDIEEVFRTHQFGHFDAKGNDLLFYPKPVHFGNFTISINPYSSAIELMLLFMPALFRQEFRSRIYFSGVTHSPLSFSTSWMKDCFLSILEQMGFYASCMLRRFGFYASGGGLIEAKVYPAESKSAYDACISFDKAILTGARIYIAHLDSSIAIREKNLLREMLGLDEGNTGILEIRDCDGAWNHAEVYCAIQEMPVVLWEPVPVYDFSGTFIFSEKAAQLTMEKLASKTHAFLEGSSFPDELEREIALYRVMTGNTAECTSQSARASAELTSQFIS